MRKFLFLTIFTLLFFSSCVEKINILDTNYEQFPIVNCIFTADSVFTVYVGLTTDMFYQMPDSIPNANVKIVSENGDTIFFQKKNTHIFTSDSVAKKGINYKLIIETSNYGILTAQSKIPSQSAKIDTANFYENTHYNPNFEQLFDKISLTIDDIPFNKLYFSENYFTDCAIISNSFYNKKGSSILFNDLNFIEQFQEIFFYCNVYYIPESTKYLVVNLKHTSQDYFLFRKSLISNNISEDNNFSIDYIINNAFTQENTEIYSNIIGGLGIFAGYNCSENFIIHTN